ncbi:hypothetical protein KY290_031156 [Solanum tuberosum]|uniref:Uncharacterized protein n=1 Tax=Solanum tuberosum TaxID=4113 RepID=A0ABQ7UA66_SOLTU|nr:hypothetical protein KY290_031156 [Solanum tuberosum]
MDLTGSDIEQEELEAKHPLKSFYLTGGSTQLVNERKDDAQAKSTYSRVRRRRKRILNNQFTVENINPKKKNIVVF